MNKTMNTNLIFRLKTLVLCSIHRLLLLLLPLVAQAKLNVVATLPDFGSLAREIGGDKINLVVLAKPTEDPHFVDARPSFVVSLRNADVLIDGGAELEIGWLPPLLQNARNPKIEIGKPGRVQASEGIRLMNVPTNVTRAAGDVHALGNPHFTVDPIIAKAIAQHIAQSFSALDPANAAFYEANYTKFEATINAKLQEWGAAMLPFQGQHVVAYHDSWPYFAHRFGLEHRHLPRTEAGNSTVAVASDRSDCANESAARQSDHRRAVSRSSHRRESGERDRREGGRVFAISGRHAGNGHLREVDRHARFAAGSGIEIICGR